MTWDKKAVTCKPDNDCKKAAASDRSSTEMVDHSKEDWRGSIEMGPEESNKGHRSCILVVANEPERFPGTRFDEEIRNLD